MSDSLTELYFAINESRLKEILRLLRLNHNYINYADVSEQVIRANPIPLPLSAIERMSNERKEILQLVQLFCIKTNCTGDCGPCKLSRVIGVLDRDPKLVLASSHPRSPIKEPSHGK